jgi:hypothetical protein
MHAKIAGELERGMALGAIHEDRDRHQVVAHRQLAAGEDRAGRDAELVPAALALEDRPARVLVARHTAAARADGLAVVAVQRSTETWPSPQTRGRASGPWLRGGSVATLPPFPLHL